MRKPLPCAFCLLIPILVFSLGGAVGAEPPPVEVRLSEYSIEMPKTLPAGPTTFLVRNEGRNSHSLKIEGPGVDELLSAPVPPHGTGTLHVTLQTGDYKVYCPIGRHAMKGMTMTLVVTAAVPKAQSFVMRTSGLQHPTDARSIGS